MDRTHQAFDRDPECRSSEDGGTSADRRARRLLLRRMGIKVDRDRRRERVCMKRAGIFIVLTVANSASSVGAQVLALLLLLPSEYGKFSLIYLVFGLASSVCLSSVAEAWARTASVLGRADTWANYSSAAIFVSCSMGIIAGLVCGVLGLNAIGMLAGGAAVALASFRVAARYYEVRTGRYRRALVADIAFLMGLGASWVVGSLLGFPRDAFLSLVAWAGGGMLASLASLKPAMPAERRLRGWVGTHRAAIGALQSESILMDVGAIATPMLLAPVLTIPSFGVYRGLSTLAAPARLLLNPARPLMAKMSPGSLLSVRSRVGLIVGAALLGLLAVAGLAIIEDRHWELGTLASLSTHSIACAVYLFGNVVGHYHYLVVRLAASSRALLRQRVIQTVEVAALPLLGVTIGGLAGAIWGIALATLLNAIGWSAVAQFLISRTKPVLDPAGGADA